MIGIAVTDDPMRGDDSVLDCRHCGGAANFWVVSLDASKRQSWCKRCYNVVTEPAREARISGTWAETRRDLAGVRW